MKSPVSRPFSRQRAVLALLAGLATLSPLSAATLTWDPVNTTNGATIDAGSGTWDLSALNTVWNNGTSNVPWSQTNATTALDSANFAGADAPEGTNYTVNVAASLAVNTTNGALRFSNNGYVLTAAEGSAHVITTRQITTDIGKSATLSGPLTFSLLNVTNVNQFTGYGTLIARDGAKFTPAGNPTFGIGSKLKLQTGSVFTSVGSVIIGGQSSDGSTTEVTVEGGSLNVAGTNLAVILANVNNSSTISTPYSNTVLTLSSGSITNSSAGGGIRFGGSTPTATNNSNVNGTFNLDGGVLTAARIYESNGTVSTAYNSTFNFNGGTLRAQANTANGSTFLQTLNTANVKVGGAVIDTNGANITIGQALLADPVSTGGGLTKLGAGTLTLSGANTYTGPTLVSAGTLAVAAPFSALTATTVNSGARLQIISGASASSLPAVTLQDGSGIELNLGSYNAGNLATASFASVDAAGNYTINLTGTNIPVGSYTVFTYGSRSGAGTASVGALPPGVTANLQEVGNTMVLNVLSPQLTSYLWATGSGTWDTTTAANWTPGVYVEGGLATFPNTAGDNTITLAGNRSPFSVAIQNNTPNAYTFTGSSLSGAATVDKTGTGLVTLAAPNSYTGATSVASGILVVSADSALGAASGSTTIASGASLGLSGGVNYNTAEPVIVSGSGYTVAVGALAATRGAIQSVSGHSTFTGPITLGAGGARFGVQNVAGASLTLSGTITPAAGVTDSTIYFRAGNENENYIVLSGSNNHWDKTASIYSNVVSGTTGVRLGVDNALPTTVSVVAGGTFASPGNTLDLNGFNQTLPGLVESDGHLQIANMKAGTTSVLTLDTATADFTSVAGINNTEAEFTVIADGLGTTALVKKGAFKQTLDGIQAYSGPTTIEAGTLAFSGVGFLQATPVTLLAGSTLDVSGIGSTLSPRTEFALTGGLSGSGTVTATDKTVIVSTTFAPGALAVTGNLTLAAGTVTTLVAAATPEASSTLTVTGAIALNGSLAITEAAGFDFVTGQNFTFATAAGGVTTGLTGVTVNGVALAEATPDVWTASIGGLDYTFTESTATLAVSGGVVITPFQAWRDTYFPGAGNDGTGIGANAADPDGDGIANLVEYATNTSPIAATPSAVVQGTNAGRLTLTFPRIDDPALTYTVEGRNDLVTGSWLPITPAAGNNPTFGFAGANPAATETVSETVIDSVLISGQPKRFLRLSIEVTP
jgi:autotransporter-associated beta strand protein